MVRLTSHMLVCQERRFVAWKCLCHRCGVRGMIFDGFPHERECPECNGSAREPIPWSELFTVGREYR